MQILEYTRKVTEEDIDALNHVNNVRYVQWVQDAAEMHWNHLATAAMKNDYIWMVLKHEIRYKGQAFLNEEVRIKTYVTASSGAISTRVVEMRHLTNDKLLVKATTEWCLINKNNKRPARLTAELSQLFL